MGPQAAPTPLSFVELSLAPSEPTDVREELRWERRARELLQRIAVAAADPATTVEAALQTAVAEVCRRTGWPIGHVLERDAGGAMVSTGIWYPEERERFRGLREASERMRFPPGEGLPGRVLATGRPIWIIDVAREANFPRARQVQDLGVHAGAGFPVLVGEAVVAVLEFFSEQISEPDEPLLEVMATIGLQ